MDRIDAFRILMEFLESRIRALRGGESRRKKPEDRIRALIVALVKLREWDGCEISPEDRICDREPELSRRLSQLAEDYLS